MMIASKPGGKTPVQLYDHLGNPKKEGDPPLGIGYDEDGMPVPDWDVVVDATHDNPDENGRRRGAKIVGAVRGGVGDPTGQRGALSSTRVEGRLGDAGSSGNEAVHFPRGARGGGASSHRGRRSTSRTTCSSSSAARPPGARSSAT